MERATVQHLTVGVPYKPDANRVPVNPHNPSIFFAHQCLLYVQLNGFNVQGGAIPQPLPVLCTRSTVYYGAFALWQTTVVQVNERTFKRRSLLAVPGRSTIAMGFIYNDNQTIDTVLDGEDTLPKMTGLPSSTNFPEFQFSPAIGHPGLTHS